MVKFPGLTTAASAQRPLDARIPRLLPRCTSPAYPAELSGIPAAPTDTIWTPATRTMSTTALPPGATRLEAWRVGPGGMPEQLHTGDRGATEIIIPATITFTPGNLYQLWLVALNGKGPSDPGPLQNWTAE